MLSLEQIRRLEQRVNEAVERINALENDKRQLKEQLTESRSQAAKLEARLEQQSKDQAAIERGILAALEQLDQLEHEIADGAGPQGTAQQISEDSDDSFAGVETTQGVEHPQAKSSTSGNFSTDNSPPAADTTPTQEVQESQQNQELDIF